MSSQAQYHNFPHGVSHGEVNDCGLVVGVNNSPRRLVPCVLELCPGGTPSGGINNKLLLLLQLLTFIIKILELLI
jgi:hypothetical protein